MRIYSFLPIDGARRKRFRMDSSQLQHCSNDQYFISQLDSKPCLYASISNPPPLGKSDSHLCPIPELQSQNWLFITLTLKGSFINYCSHVVWQEIPWCKETLWCQLDMRSRKPFVSFRIVNLMLILMKTIKLKCPTLPVFVLDICSKLRRAIWTLVDHVQVKGICGYSARIPVWKHNAFCLKVTEKILNN